MNSPKIFISWGELVDKITILEIKEAELETPAAVANVKKDLQLLQNLYDEIEDSFPELSELKLQLREINQKLWMIEDAIRDKEKKKDFGKKFIELARSVYQTNDERARIKKNINMLLGSDLVEEKSYSEY